MSSDRTSKKLDSAGNRPVSSADDGLDILFKHVGPRKSAPDSVKAEVFAKVDQVWQDKLNRRRRARQIWALAASLLIVAGLGWAVGWFSSPQPKGQGIVVAEQPVASLEAWFSRSTVQPFERGTSLVAGTEVSTVDGERAALRLNSGVSLRLGPSSRVRLTASDSVELLTGVVYVDSGPGSQGPQDAQTGGGPKIEIRTHFGHATDIGTQFELRLDSERLSVQVREGIVRLDVEGESHDAQAGTGISIDSAGEVRREALPSSQDWAWAIETAPPFELEGATLAQALRWVARETGWVVRFEDAALEEEAETITTHGSLEGLTPRQAPELVVPTAGLAYTLNQGVLSIHRP